MLSSIAVDDTFKGGEWNDITTGVSCWYPALSPDGKTLTFTTYGPDGGRAQIFSMAVNGKAKKNLSQNAFTDSNASWSPDGKKIVFTSIRNEPVKDKVTGEEKPGPSRNEIYLMNADGTEQKRLVTSPEATTHHLAPTWSPDGQHILFEAEHGGPSDLYVVRSDGSDGDSPTLLARGRESHASWSPNGKSIVVSSRRDGPMAEIYIMDADGKNPVRLTDNKAQDVHPCWSPDGQRIAFASDRSGEYEIYVMQRDGSNTQRITQDPEEPNTDPFWSTIPRGR
jgi:TolB protein